MLQSFIHANGGVVVHYVDTSQGAHPFTCCFQVLVIMKKTVMNVHVQVFPWKYARLSLAPYLEVKQTALLRIHKI